MKLKIVVAPTLIVLILVAIFFLVTPKYLEIKSGEYKQYLDKKQKINDLSMKEQNVEKLIGTLTDNASKEEVLKKYIPESQKEEMVLDSLNFLAVQSGLSVYALNVSNIAKGSASDSDSVNVKRFDLNDINANSSSTSMSAPTAKTFQASLGVYGDYEKVKILVDKIYRLERFNSIVSIKIARPQSNDKDAVANGLQTDLVIKFNYLDSLSPREAININSAVFSDGKFDLAIVDNIEKNMDAAMSALDVNAATNRSNPFLP